MDVDETIVAEHLYHQRMDKDQQWLDVAEIMKDKASSLRVGEIMSVSSLQDCMAALEVMDKKMDAGLTYGSNPERLLSVDDALKRNKVKTSNFSYSELISIFDELKKREICRLCSIKLR